MSYPLRWADAETRWNIFVSLLFLSLSLSLAYVHALFIDVPFQAERWRLHLEIVNHTALSPYRYRPLIPVIVQLMARPLEALFRLSAQRTVFLGYIAAQFLSFFVGLMLFHYYLRRWFNYPHAFVGTLLMAALLPFTFIHSAAIQGSHTEFIAFTLALWLIDIDRPGWFLLLLFVSTLNRETACLLPFLYFVCNIGRIPLPRFVGWSVLYTFIFIATYGTLRLLLGYAPQVGDVPWMWRFMFNIRYYGTYLTVALVFGPLWCWAFMNIRTKPIVLRRALWLIVPFFALHLFFAHIHEVRYFLELAPIIVPLALITLFRLTPEDRQDIVTLAQYPTQRTSDLRYSTAVSQHRRNGYMKREPSPRESSC